MIHYLSDKENVKELDVLQMIIDIVFAHEMKLDKIQNALEKIVEELESRARVYCKKCDEKIADMERLVTPTDFRKRFPSCPHCDRELKEYDVFYLIGEERI
jgi:hypothetical protein